MRILRNVLAGFGLAVWTCFGTLAHDGPEHEIAELTLRIEAGESADLLTQRAIEYQVLGKYAEAAKDLERALKLEEGSVLAMRELIRAQFSLGKTNEALSTATRAVKLLRPGPDHAYVLMLRADLLRRAREFQKALDDANTAVREYPGNVEWYLTRSQLHALLNQKTERIKGLDEGIKATGSGLLDTERVDALIADGQSDEALALIEKELKSSRLRSSWLIRRAKVRLGIGKSEGAKADLEAAIDELDRRLNTKFVDASLLVDRGTALDLLGKPADARKDYEQARDKGFADENLRERIRILKDKAPAE